ncbi:hypothetical protein BGY98DRAFT_1068802 [Russula aff. rugulosa BPL654]|nr:hypothetical protein BGY98DRAFT_1068802 [Russula aff. rugulosa BPL654]
MKPQNIVAVSSQLFIIDFDLAVRVDGPDTLIDDRWCGTHGWMAPEIGERPDGPRCLYSPIRADLWSVKRDRLSTNKDLLNKDPRLRPCYLCGTRSQEGNRLQFRSLYRYRSPVPRCLSYVFVIPPTFLA